MAKDLCQTMTESGGIGKAFLSKRQNPKVIKFNVAYMTTLNCLNFCVVKNNIES